MVQNGTFVTVCAGLFSLPFLVAPTCTRAVFFDASAFKQLLCSTHWQNSKSLFNAAKSLHSRVLCCDAGSHLKVVVDPLSAGLGHECNYDGFDFQCTFNWTTPDDQACDTCGLGQYSPTVNINRNCTPAARDQFVPAPGMNAATNCSNKTLKRLWLWFFGA